MLFFWSTIRDDINFDETEDFHHLLQLQEAHYYVDFPHHLDEIKQKLKEAENKIVKALQLKKAAGHTWTLTMLFINSKKLQEEIELVKQETEAVEMVSNEELEELRRKVEIKIKERVKKEQVLDKINNVKMSYELLNIKIETENLDTFRVLFFDKINKPEEPIKYVKIMMKEEIDFTRYEVLEQRGTPDDVFEQMNIQLMRTNDIIEFLVSLRNYFDSTLVSQ